MLRTVFLLCQLLFGSTAPWMLECQAQRMILNYRLLGHHVQQVCPLMLGRHAGKTRHSLYPFPIVANDGPE